MKTDDLIENLSKNLTAVGSLPNRKSRLIRHLVFSILGTGLTFSLFSIRANLAQVIFTYQFVIGAFLLFIGWILSSYSLVTLEEPSSSSKGVWRWPIVLMALLSLMYLLFLVLSPNQDRVDGLRLSGISCSEDILFLSMLPGIFIFFLLKNGATTRPDLIGIFWGLICAMMASFALQFSCPSDLSSHLLVWHFAAPFVVLSLAGFFLGRKFLKW